MTPRLLPLLALLLAAACKEPPPAPPAPPAAARPTAAKNFLGNAPDGKLHVYFLDVGQGDSALIVSPEGRTVLVDAGPASAVNHLVNRLPELLAARLDLVVLTHPSPDHYGALSVVQKIADPRRLLEPQLPEAPSDYDALLTALGSAGVEISSPAPNPAQPQELTRVPLGKGVELTVLWPRAPTEPLVQPGVESAQHEANSIVLRLTYGKTSVLFAGDARSETEAALLKRGAELSSTLLKVGAHGADAATTREFLQKVRPRAAILSAGAGNKLGVPAQPVLTRLQEANARVFRTDEAGEVHAVSDGTQFVLTTQKLAKGEAANTEHVFEPQEEELTIAATSLPSPVAEKSAPTVKATPVKAVVPQPKEAEAASRYGKVVDLDSLGTPRENGGRTEKKGSAATGEKYYASKQRPLFHKAMCRSVKQISAQNLKEYASREAALQDNKQPANDCKP
jgi:beta-lactamase superfamily II metal-dependent hydrolase